MIYRANRKLKRIIVKGVGYFTGINSKKYWDHRFSSNWEIQNGRTQSTLFATGFSLTNFARSINPKSVLDYGCGLADSMPVLKMAFPEASLHFYDFSSVAMDKASLNYGTIANAYDFNDPRKFELVYCSNVIEHIKDEHLFDFLNNLIARADKFVIIQAPFQEYLEDGSRISSYNKSSESEHERTIDLDLLEYLNKEFLTLKWSYELMRIPIAWDKGDQVFFIGIKS
jgi:hypothetical protein